MPSKREPHDEKGFIQQLESLQGSILRFFAGRGFAPEECRDLAQETFLRAVRGRKDFRWDSTVGTYVLRIAANVANNSIRSRKTQKRDGVEIQLDAAGGQMDSLYPENRPSPLDLALAKERRRLLREAMLELPPQMRRCILLRIDQDRGYQEIADVLRLSINTVKSQLHEGKKRLRQALRVNLDLRNPEKRK